MLAGCGDAPDPEADGWAPGQVIDGRGSTTAAVESADQLAQLRGDLDVLGLANVDLDAPAFGDDLTFGPTAPFVSESDLELDRSSPAGLLDSALQALALEDPAALARLSRSRAADPTLNQDHADDAQRRFLAPAVRPYWERIKAAVRAGRVQVQEDGAGGALLLVDVGGAAGAYRIRMKKEGDAWYLVG
ncbi:hypothetical protein OAX78_00935 [Planctomycetota bacterium]|nr:hypothetical protein [Planctomycetota bacterium]